MCELFAMSSLMPTSVGFSLELLARHGGAEGPHRDGWGVAYFVGRDALLLRETEPASQSRLAHYMGELGPPSDLVLSHIRLATFGSRELANTQPFVRELGGRAHVFAHNGDLPALAGRRHAVGGRFRPIGETDSEHAFCRLLERLAPFWDQAGQRVPELAVRLDVIGGFAAELRAQGIANFLYADGDTLFAHADRRVLPEEPTAQPGLYMLTRNCAEPVPDLSRSGVTLTTADQLLTLLASVPLTAETWQPLPRGELLAIANGQLQGRIAGI